MPPLARQQQPIRQQALPRPRSRSAPGAINASPGLGVSTWTLGTGYPDLRGDVLATGRLPVVGQQSGHGDCPAGAVSASPELGQIPWRPARPVLGETHGTCRAGRDSSLALFLLPGKTE